jgi:hypothetical protein
MSWVWMGCGRLSGEAQSFAGLVADQCNSSWVEAVAVAGAIEQDITVWFASSPWMISFFSGVGVYSSGVGNVTWRSGATHGYTPD